MGRAPTAPDPACYAHQHAHCDVLVAGGGPAGLAAALAAARAGARVIIADEGSELGGSLLSDRADIDGEPALNWVRRALAELRALPEVTVLSRSTVFGYFDHNALAIVEHAAVRAPLADAHAPAQRLWKDAPRKSCWQPAHSSARSYFQTTIVRSDARSAARTYANRYAVTPGTAPSIHE